MTTRTSSEVPLSSVAARVGQSLIEEASMHAPEVLIERDGRVDSVADGVLRLSGLEDIGYGQLLRVEGCEAMVMDLGERGPVAALLSDAQAARRVAVGSRARRAHDELGIPVGEALLGRVVDPLGHALDGGDPPRAERMLPLERAAPQIFERSDVRAPLYTGVLAIDAMFPIGRGQRELIAGDEGTGKTALAVDAMLNQARGDVVCVYAAIGQRRAETWRIREQLERHGVAFTIVAAAEDENPALRVLTPYAATSIGEYHRDKGSHALVVYDDLSAHAAAWRELSLLLCRPPGREAFPGDVFYLHSRLLERSAQLSDALGGGSLTALPICSLESGRLTAYIPTNLVSITDGQLVTSSALFTSGQRPAIDASLSVSRVGARAQSALFSALTGQLKLDYAAFLELEEFSRLGTRIEPETKRRIDFGERIRALLVAQQGSPLSPLDELVRLALTKHPKRLLQTPVSEVGTLASDVVASLEARHPELARDVAREAITLTRLLELVAAEGERLSRD